MSYICGNREKKVPWVRREPELVLGGSKTLEHDATIKANRTSITYKESPRTEDRIPGFRIRQPCKEKAELESRPIAKGKTRRFGRGKGNEVGGGIQPSPILYDEMNCHGLMNSNYTQCM